MIPFLIFALAASFAAADVLPDSSIAAPETALSEVLAEGLTHRHILSQKSDTGLPINIHVLEVDLKHIQLRPALALDQVIGQETVASIANRHRAVAATNSGFSYSNSPWSRFHGDPRGFLVMDGTVISEPNRGAWAIGFPAHGLQHPFLIRPDLRIAIKANRQQHSATGLNRERKDDELIVYTPIWGRSTLTDGPGLEAVVENGKVTAVRVDRAPAVIPANGFVLSASGTAVSMIEALQVGDTVELTYSLRSLDDASATYPIAGHHYVSGGPLLAHNGAPVRGYDAVDHWFTKPDFTDRRHPRTAIGISSDGSTLYLSTVDGRQPDISVGFTLKELTAFMLGLGAADVYNLDGGGSTTMVVGGKAVNRFSDIWGGYLGDDPRERRRCEALLLFARPAP